MVSVLSLRAQSPVLDDADSDTVAATTMLGTYYADRFVGRHTSSGDIFRQNQYTAAHRSLAFGTYLLVTYPTTGQSVVVRVNDRCPKSGVLDMTKIAVHALGIRGSGKVNVTILDPTMGYMIWATQDTLAMTREEYLAFRDRSANRRISPYNNCCKPSAADAQPASNALPSNMVAKATKAAVPPKRSQPPSLPLEQPATIEPSPQDTVTTQTQVRPKGPLYDLELCIAGSNAAALMEMNRLPQNFQSKVIFERNDANREVRVILQLADTRSHTVRVQAELIDIFPESCVISHQN
ncbi:MAG: septal ring lytic transglycosylase RlpA family protein [Bacteroidales bacterium]|nr:septal ring lytic transglycosylase RlpA family protein [Bacteroidales bacterium]